MAAVKSRKLKIIWQLIGYMIYFPKQLKSPPLADKKPPAVDLPGHLSLCEMNYYRLFRLLPGLRKGRESWAFHAGSATEVERDLHIQVSVTDEAPYTTTLDISQSRADKPEPKIVVRLYHDAEMAEIVSWDNHRNWFHYYSYPNPKMYQPDEKLALNRFLGEWLTYCRELGYACRENCEEVLVTKK